MTIKLRDNAVRSIESLIFKNKTTGKYHAVAGGHQFSSIWVRDFSNATIGLVEKDTWTDNKGNVLAT